MVFLHANELKDAQPRPQTRTADAAGQGRTPLYDKPRKNIEYSGLGRQELAGVAAHGEWGHGEWGFQVDKLIMLRYR